MSWRDNQIKIGILQKVKFGNTLLILALNGLKEVEF